MSRRDAKIAVGLTTWRGEFPTYAGPQVLNTLEVTYSDAVIAAGMTPLAIPNGLEPDLAADVVAAIDGLVLTGGGDMDPSTYGRGRQRVEESDVDVDLFEIALVRAAEEQAKPVLAICRGLQLLNVAKGGTLIQDVTTSGTAHAPINPDDDPVELEARRHPVTLERDGVLAEIFETTVLEVNTLHHQGIDALAPGLVVEGRAPDGLVEAARWAGSWWAVAVQWHPERLPAEHCRRLFAALREVILAGQTGSTTGVSAERMSSSRSGTTL